MGLLSVAVLRWRIGALAARHPPDAGSVPAEIHDEGRIFLRGVRRRLLARQAEELAKAERASA